MVVVETVKIKLTETKALELYRLDDGVLFFDYRNNITVDIEDVKLAFDLYVEYSENSTLKVLIALGEFSSITSEARRYSEAKKMPTPAQAIVIKSLAQRILVKFYGLLRRDSHPFKYFSNIDEALNWLRKY